MTTCSPPTLRISTRQLAESAYRALRVAGVPSGVAEDAARDTVELQATHGRGLRVLVDVLHGAPARRVGRGETTESPAPDAIRLDAHGSSALLLAVPLLAMVSDRHPRVTIRTLAHPAALSAELRRRSRREAARYGLATEDGAPMLTVEAGRLTTGPAWDAAWSGTHDVQLSLTPATSASAARRRATSSPPASEGLDVELAGWQRLQGLAARYLVSDSVSG